MKAVRILLLPLFATCLPVAPVGAEPPSDRGPMPAEYRNTIHSLFSSHKAFTREWKPTEKGYVSKTVSADPAMARLLQLHVKQMQTRLDGGGFVRMWDPAFREFMKYHDQIDVVVRNVENGVEVEVTGRSAEAIRVAQNHARIVTGFVEKGESVMHEKHDPVFPE
jgi:hypothetical protein